MSKKIYGIMAEFDTATEMVDAANEIRLAGYTKTDAFSPFPLHEIDEALGIKRSILPYLIFAGGITGLLTALGLVYFVHVLDYPIIVGGRPYFSLPSFIPPMFELTILFSAGTAVFGMLFLNGLPSPYHPVFNVPRFALATREKFFVIIEAEDPNYDYETTRKFMESLKAQEVFDVPE
jgi:Alternative complex III, ActD subunit